MHGHLIIFLTLFFSFETVFATCKKKDNCRCDTVIQMGIMNNLVSTGKLKEQFPDLPKESVDFIASDFERAKDLAEKARKSGKPPPTALFTQVMERTDLTEPVKGKHFPVEGKSDLLSKPGYAAHKMALEEEKAAHALSDMGYKVKFNDGQITKDRMLKEGLNPAKSPDLEVNGKIFDIYTPQSTSSISQVDGVLDKVQKGQTHRVVVNVSETYDAPEKLQQLSKALREKNPEGLHEVIAIRKKNDGATELVRVFP